MAKLRKKIKIGNGCMTAILIALLFVVIYAVSADYKERFKAEYYQTAIRYGKLKQW